MKVVSSRKQLVDPNQTYVLIRAKSKDSHFLYLIKNQEELGSAIMSRFGGFIQSIANYDSEEVKHGGSALMETCLRIAKKSDHQSVELNATDSTGFHYKFGFRFPDERKNQAIEHYLNSKDTTSPNNYTGIMSRQL